MKVEVLYFDGCPHYKPTVDLVREVLREERVSVQVAEIHVADEVTARATSFLGSPTIRVNGLDVEPEARSSRDFGIMCRTYLTDGRREGLPSRDLIRQAVRAAGSANSTTQDCCEPIRSGSAAGGSRSPSLLMAGSVVAAIGASLCCTLPIIFALTGFSILGASAFFESIRPYLLAVTFGLLGLGFYYAYRPLQQEGCVPGSVCAIPSKRRAMRFGLWVVSAVAVAFAAFPYYSGPVAELLLSGGL